MKVKSFLGWVALGGFVITVLQFNVIGMVVCAYFISRGVKL